MTSPTPSRPLPDRQYVITTNSDGQPRATFDPDYGWIRVEFSGRVRWLSAAVAEELAIALSHAARLARGEAG